MPTWGHHWAFSRWLIELLHEIMPWRESTPPRQAPADRWSTVQSAGRRRTEFSPENEAHEAVADGQ